MKKIRLELDSLTVESFATTKDEGREPGTVRGHGSGIGCATAYCSGNPCSGPNDPSVSADGGCACEDMFNPASTGC